VFPAYTHSATRLITPQTSTAAVDVAADRGTAPVARVSAVDDAEWDI
jgi:hypothetical protein